MYYLYVIYAKRRDRTLLLIVIGLYCILLGFSYRNTAKVFSRFVQRSQPVSIDVWYFWYLYACKFLKLGHHLHSSLDKSMMEGGRERTIHHIKDKIENFDESFPCRMEKCKLHHAIS
jgi:hypothetical protein